MCIRQFLPCVLSRSSVTSSEVTGKGFQTFFSSYMKMTIFFYVVTRYTFPKEIVSSNWFSNFQAIDLNVAEWINFLVNKSEM